MKFFIILGVIIIAYIELHAAQRRIKLELETLGGNAGFGGIARIDFNDGVRGESELLKKLRACHDGIKKSSIVINIAPNNTKINPNEIDVRNFSK